MEDHLLDSLLDGLDIVQLQYLQQKISAKLSAYHHVDSTEDQFPFVTERATYYSTASTLYHSGRSTPVASSITSDWKASFDHHTLPEHSLSYPINHPPWHTNTLSDDRSLLQACIDQQTIHQPIAEPKIAEAALKEFFCTYCIELGSWKTFKTKQDWKRHEEDYHDGTGLQWFCQVTGCSGLFSRGLEFRSHLKKSHEGKMYPRDCKEVRPTQRIFACGFENCRGLNTTWKHHCDHVAIHMEQGEKTWSYDRTIRNLLKHHRVSDHWKQTYTTMSPQLQMDHRELTWDIQTTRSMRDQLETHNFDVRLGDFLLDLFYKGFPPASTGTLMDPTLTSGLASSDFHTNPPSIPPILPSSIDLGFDPSFVGCAIPQIGTGHPSNDVTPRNTRNSVFMMDAPPLDGSSTFTTPPDDPFEEIPRMANELISIGGFINETIPTYESGPHAAQEQTSTQDSSKSHSPRALVTKSREWLASKKSQHFQHVVIDHPDVSPNLRLPSGSSRKRSTTTLHRVRGD